jgi:hypothetical protein
VTADGFDERWAETVVAELGDRGVELAPGLSDAEIAAAGEALGVSLPTELALLLTTALPVSQGWAPWRDGPETVAADARAWAHRRFAFDIEHNDYWHPLFGERPDDLASAMARAVEVLDAAPPLVPIYGHRFMVGQASDGGGGVLSVWQAVDSIFYGYDLADYLARELGISRPPWASSTAPQAPVWEDLFDL